MNFAFYKILDMLFNFMEWAILIDVILSYVMRGSENAFTQIVHTITEPLLTPGRKIQEKILPGLMLDFSPVFAILIIYLIRNIVFAII
ncbi:YggT family protein [Clostridium rectalis]|uniref:YggT family protein n=1 Tax=Clostridium rectalis TaxID=2040295 RepID=UPI000F62C2B6|nr:YggT family protein [Clostridium rectalis]